jgi:nitrite reductase (NAD(P)H)
MREVGRVPGSLGCELCKPAIGSILASLYNRHVLDKSVRDLQDTNDKFLANIQRNGTFSVVPRVAGGEITPDRLITIGTLAKKYNLYCKITGGQRIDMFGAKKQDLLDIWTELVNAGMESGHAYAKSLRTVKVSDRSPNIVILLTDSYVELRGNYMVSIWSRRQRWHGNSPRATVQKYPIAS